MWYGVLFSVCAMVACADEGAATGQGRPSDEPTPLFVLSRLTSEAMRREALADEPRERGEAIRALCELHRRLQSDPRYDQVDKLQDLRGRVYSRLRRVQTELKREVAARRDAGVAKASAGRKVSPAELLEQQQQDELALAAADSLAASLQYMDAAIGGPNELVAHGGMAVADHGDALVDLIERTINPAFWDTNGGPGTIVYYQPLQCLVVRASGEVHHRLGGALEGLRAAGR